MTDLTKQNRFLYGEGPDSEWLHFEAEDVLYGGDLSTGTRDEQGNFTPRVHDIWVWDIEDPLTGAEQCVDYVIEHIVEVFAEQEKYDPIEADKLMAAAVKERRQTFSDAIYACYRDVDWRQAGNLIGVERWVWVPDGADPENDGDWNLAATYLSKAGRGWPRELHLWEIHE